MKDIRSAFNIKKNHLNLSIIIIIISVSIIASLITGLSIYCMNNKNVLLTQDEKEILDTFKSIKSSYYKDVDSSQIKDAAISGMLNYLGEDYSELLNSDANNVLSDKLNGKYQGIGLTLNFDGKDILVIDVHSDSPAELAGIQVNDYLISVDGTVIDKNNYSSISELVKNKKSVEVVVKRDSDFLTKTIEVKNIIKPSVSASILEKNNKKVGYIYIETFSNTTDKQFESALKSLEDKEIDSLIIDVRSNTGGYLEIARNIASLFIIKGKPLYQLETKENKEIIYDETNTSRNYDVVVIINQLSASASEILALSLKESYGAILVGAKSYGKGRVQQIDDISNNEKVKLTIANWYSPLGNSIDGVGIIPGVHVELDKKYALDPSTENDIQLQKSLEILTN